MTVLLQDGRTLTEQVPNPVGDVGHRPFTVEQVHATIAALLGDRDTVALARVVDALPGTGDVRRLLAEPVTGTVAQRLGDRAAGIDIATAGDRCVTGSPR